NPAAATTTVEAVWGADVGLATSANPSAPGEAVTLSATVIGSAATGTVIFQDGSTALGSAAVSNGLAQLAVQLAPGVHPLTAVYSGDVSNPPGTSGVVQQQVTAIVAGGGTMTWTYGYDPVGNRTSIVDPNG